MKIADNEVHDVGLTYPSAIALTGGGKDCEISHNHVYDTPYSAVTCGGQDNLIEGNRIHHAMQELHDGAGIYCFGGKGLVLRGNFIYDIVDTGGYGASAYYLDEQCEGCVVEKNLSINVARPSHNHMATEQHDPQQRLSSATATCSSRSPGPRATPSRRTSSTPRARSRSTTMKGSRRLGQRALQQRGQDRMQQARPVQPDRQLFPGGG